VPTFAGLMLLLTLLAYLGVAWLTFAVRGLVSSWRGRSRPAPAAQAEAA